MSRGHSRGHNSPVEETLALYALVNGGGGSGSAPLGPIYPRAASNIGPAAMSTSGVGIPVGTIFYASNALLSGLVYDASGPYVWGNRLIGASICRYDLGEEVLDVVPLNDVSEAATAPFSLAQADIALDGNGDAWTIDITSNTLVHVQREPPKVIATYPIPNAQKVLLAYDAVNSNLVLATASLPNLGPLAGGYFAATFNLATTTFSADVAIGALGSRISALLVAGGFIFIASYTGTHQYVSKNDPLTLATLAFATIATSGTEPTFSNLPTGLVYLANSGSPKIFVTNSTHVSRISVGAMTLDTAYAVPGASFLAGLAFNPNDGTLWVTDQGTNPAVVYQLHTPLGAPSTTTFTLDSISNSDTSSIVWDATNAQFVISSDALDKLYLVDASGSVNGTQDIAGGFAPLAPGGIGSILTSQGPGQGPIWSSP